jgi:hypothetical protein
MPPSTNVKSIIPYIGSMNFDGVDDACTVPDSAIPASAFQSGFVLFGVINPRGLGGNSEGRIFDKSSGLTANAGFFLRMQAGNGLDFKMRGGASIGLSGISGAQLLNRNTHFVTQVSSSGNVTFYINGVFNSSGNGGVDFPNTTNPLTIGNRSTATDRAFDGRIAQVGILSLTGRGNLTQDEVTALYLHNIIPAGTKLLNLETTANQIRGNQWLDKSGNNNHATIVGPTFSYESPTKRIAQIGAQRQLDGRFDGVVSGGVTIAGGAMVFDGVNGRVNCGNNAALQRFERITIYGWCNSTNLGTNKEIIQKRDIANSRYGLTLGSNNKIYFTVANGTDSKDTISPNNYPTGANFLVYGEYDGSEARLYVDNELVKTEAYTGNVVAVGGSLIIGARDSGGLNPMNGLVLTTALFNRILTADQRTAIFNAGPNAPCPVKHGLVGEWSGRDWEGPAATPTRIFDVASWDGMNVQ